MTCRTEVLSNWHVVYFRIGNCLKNRLETLDIETYRTKETDLRYDISVFVSPILIPAMHCVNSLRPSDTHTHICIYIYIYIYIYMLQ